MPYWIFVIIGASLLISIIICIHQKTISYIWTIFPLFFVLTILVSIPQIGIDASKLNPHYNTLRYKENIPIYSLRTTEFISGNFTLGCGL